MLSSVLPTHALACTADRQTLPQSTETRTMYTTRSQQQHRCHSRLSNQWQYKSHQIDCRFIWPELDGRMCTHETSIIIIKCIDCIHGTNSHGLTKYILRWCCRLIRLLGARNWIKLRFVNNIHSIGCMPKRNVSSWWRMNWTKNCLCFKLQQTPWNESSCRRSQVSENVRSRAHEKKSIPIIVNIQSNRK